MPTTSVTSKGQVTIPVAVRRALGIAPGTKLRIVARAGVGVIEVAKPTAGASVANGAGMIRLPAKNRRNNRMLADFDAASLAKRRA